MSPWPETSHLLAGYISRSYTLVKTATHSSILMVLCVVCVRACVRVCVCEEDGENDVSAGDAGNAGYLHPVISCYSMLPL